MAEQANLTTVRATAFLSGVCVGHLLRGAKLPNHAQILAELGLDPKHPFAFEVRIPEDRALAVLDRIATPSLPLDAVQTIEEHHSPVFHLASAAETVADLLDIAGRFYGLIWSSMPMHTELAATTAVLASRPVPDTPGAYAAQRYILIDACVSAGRLFVSTPFRARRLRLQGPPPPDLSKWAHLADSVEFDAPRGEIVVDRAALDLPLARPDNRISAWLEGTLERELTALRVPKTTTDQVATLIRQSLRRGPERGEVARRLGWSERTLGRRLGAEGRTFREVVDRVRLESATALLPDHSPTEVSERLGFSDLRGFERAFRRWTGISPSAWLRP